MNSPVTARTASAPFRRRPLLALSRAEFLQFRRNRTLVVTAIGFPVAIPLVLYFVTRDGGTADPATVAATFDVFALFALLFVQFYTVLSMVTTRRSEGVLKRLRTGEAADWQILTAPAVPGFVLTFGAGAVVAVLVYGTGAPLPVNGALIVFALLAGAVIFALLALATSAFTKNAEAAQITSMPVMALAMAGLPSIRAVLPERAAEILGWTPFAAISDLVHLGAAGSVGSGAAGAGTTAADFTGVLADIGQPLATLAVWTLLAIAIAYKCFRWDDRG